MSIVQNAGAGRGSFGFYNGVVNQSLRFEDGDNAYLNKTLSASNGTIFTFSCWVKLGNIGINRCLLQGYEDANNFTQILLYSGNQVGIYSGTSNTARLYAVTTALQRDTGAWYNIVVKFNGTSSSEEFKIYVNGVNQALTTTTALVAHQSSIGNSNAHYIGNNFNQSLDMDGYMAEVNFIDGTALDADSFGETKGGVWIPKNTSGLTFGTNGFRLQFDQTGTGTASTSTIGADISGNNNHFTSNNLVSTDSNMPDCPENNFATFNPLVVRAGAPTLTEGNLKLTGSGTDYDRSYATIGLTSGKWYAEFLYVSGDNRGMFGVVREDARASDASDTYIGSILNTFGIDFRARVYTGTGSSSDGQELFDGTNFDTGDIGLLCFDIDNGKLWFGRRDVSGSSTIWYDSSGNNNGDPSAGSNPTYTGTYTGHTWFIGCHDYNGTTIIANFGQDGSFAGEITSQGVSDANGIGDFNYIESGFLALCTSNLPDVTIGPGKSTQADDHFNTVLYTGDGSESDNDISGVGFSPDFIWIKQRGATTDHQLVNTVAGITKTLISNVTDAEYTDAARVNSVSADGFQVFSSGQTNADGGSFVAWNWLAGTAASGSESGNNPAFSSSSSSKAGFSIVSYTGTGSAGTVGHGCGAVPSFIFIKNRDATDNWAVYYGDNTDYLILNTSAATADAATWWNDTTPTDSVFTVGTDHAVNADGEKYIAYCFTEIEGYSKFGSYTGNGNADGPFIFTGFRPAWVLFKGSTQASNWCILDNKRSPFNLADDVLQANENNAEATNLSDVDFLSNGIKIRDTVSNDTNINGQSYIYLAFAEQPFKFANAR